MNKISLLLTLFLFSGSSAFSSESIFKYEILVYRSTVVSNDKKCTITLKLYPSKLDSIQMYIEIDDKSSFKTSLLTNLNYIGFDSSGNEAFKNARKNSKVIKLKNYEGFEVWISEDKFNQARIKVSIGEMRRYFLENGIYKKIFSE